MRTPKIKAAAFQLAAVAAASTPSPSSNHSPVPPLPRSGSDLSIDDSCNFMVDAKNAPRFCFSFIFSQPPLNPLLILNCCKLIFC